MLRKNIKRFEALLQQYNTDYYSTERYLQRKLCPIISMNMIPELMKRPDALQVAQRIYSSIMTKVYLRRLIDLVNESKDTRQQLAVEASVLQAIGHGDCGELTSRLIIDLMMMPDEFPVIRKYMLNPELVNNHAFVVLRDKEGNEIALDPFFNICCPVQEYPKQSKVLDYFRSIYPDWEFPKKIATIEYKKEDYVKMRATLKADLKALNELNHPDLLELKHSFNRFSELRGQSFSFKRVKPFLMQCFIESVKFQGEQLQPLQIEFVIDPQSFTMPERHAELAFFAIDVKAKIVADIKKITGLAGYKNLHDCLDQGMKDLQHFSRALRIACTGTGEVAYLVVKRLLEDKVILMIDVNEQAGEKKKAAIDYALEKGDERIVKLLIEHGAKVILHQQLAENKF